MIKNYLGRAALALVALSLSVAPVAAESWNIDPVHSDLSFKVRHLVARSTGHFNDFGGTIEFDPAKPAAAKVNLTVQVASVDTGNEGRDGHLKSDDFFNAEAFPTMTFVSTGIVPQKDGVFMVTGDFTLRDITKTVSFPVEFLGSAPGMRGGKVAGFAGDLTINRTDFGVKWNRGPADGLVLGEDVKISFNIEASTPAEEEAKSEG